MIQGGKKMSLWEKWEKEKLEQQGIKVERKSDVEIHDTHPKTDFQKQAWIVAGALLACFLVVYLALVLNAIYGGNWSDSLIVRMFIAKQEQRQSISSNQ